MHHWVRRVVPPGGLLFAALALVGVGVIVTATQTGAEKEPKTGMIWWGGAVVAVGVVGVFALWHRYRR